MPAELTKLQSQVLAGLLAGGSIAAVAREHRIHRSTIYNWRNEHSAFTAALNEVRNRQHAAMYDAAHDLASRAFETLNALLSCDDSNMRLRAAQTIIRSIAPAGIAQHQPPEFATGPDALRERMNHQSALKALPQPLGEMTTAAPELYPDAEIRTPAAAGAAITAPVESTHSTLFDTRHDTENCRPVETAQPATAAAPRFDTFDTIRHSTPPPTPSTPNQHLRPERSY
jgi:transposase-like protein